MASRDADRTLKEAASGRLFYCRLARPYAAKNICSSHVNNSHRDGKK